MARPPRTAPASSPFTGKTLGRCRFARPIGRGGTATVFHATYLPLKRDVAVKILRPDAAASEEARSRFIEEARALAKLDHPNVVRVFDVVEDGGYLLIIMDFVPGRNLLQVVGEEDALDPESALAAVRQVAEALDHCHGQGVLHRDVKPANIIMDDEGRTVLVDFGNAEAVGEAADRKGTAHYVAPEVFQGKRQDEKTDTYALGATLFHLLTGSPPHDGETVAEILKAHETGKIRSPSQVNPGAGIPKEVDQLVKRSMASARGYRFLAREFVAALDEALPAVRGGARKPRTRRPRARGAAVRSSSPPMAAIGLVALLALLAIGAAVALFLVKGGKEAPPAEVLKEAAKVETAKEEAVPEGNGHLDPGFDKRASGREAREAAGAKAFSEAEDFASANGTSHKAVAARFLAVGNEYAELAVGRRAKEQARLWEERGKTDEERATQDEELREMARREKEMRAEALKRCEESVQRMRFAEALSALDDTSPAGAGVEDWKRRKERLNLLIGFAEALGTDIEGSPVAVHRIRNDFGRLGEKVISASAEGVTLSGSAGQREVPWAELKPMDVVLLSRQVMRTTGESRLMLAAFCWEAGLKDEGRREMENALLTDRTGTISGRIEELFGPEEER